MIGRTNVGGGSGGTGATLVVSAPADVTVTATKDNKTYTRVANSDGIATFKGLSNGTWALSMSDSSHDPTTPVDVIVTTDYYVTLAFFTATINITYPAGSTCKAVHTDGTELTAPDTSGTWSCVVPSAGTWTVTCTDGTKKKSESVEITTDGQSENIVLNYQLVLFDSTTSPSSSFSGSFATKAIPLSASFGDYSGAPSANYSNDSYVGLSQEHHSNGFWYYSKDGGLIDLSNYSTINCTIIGLSGDGNKYLSVRDSLNGYGNTNTIATKDIATGTISVPIEAIKSAYIGIMLYSEVTVQLTKLWLE